jgi:hypothetical protein
MHCREENGYVFMFAGSIFALCLGWGCSLGRYDDTYRKNKNTYQNFSAY